MFALRAMKKVRGKFGAPADGEVTIDEHLAALIERVTTLKSCGVDLLKSAIHAFRTLWLDEDVPALVEPLATKLLLAEERLDQWRELDGRVAAEKALAFVLSWYEDINLDVLQHMRAKGKWIHDPNLIKRLQDRAYTMVQYALVHA